jgi:hypothetical protein
MISVTATEFIKGFGRHNLLAQREAIAITNHGHVSGYYISAHEYEELQKAKAAIRHSYTVKTMPDELYQEIINSKVDPEFAPLNSLLDDQESPDNRA